MNNASKIVRALPLPMIRVGNKERLVHPLGREPLIVPESTARILSLCNSFRSIEDHSCAISTKLGLSESDSMRTAMVLRRLEERGLFVSKEDYIERARRSSSSSEPTPIEQVCIVTSNRPREMARCIKSIVRSVCKRHGIVISCFDDSTNAEMRARNRKMVRQCSLEFPTQVIRYCGPREKRHLCKTLVSGGIPADLTSYALGERHMFSPGANRNVMLLATQGSGIISCDDDVIWKTVRPEVIDPGLRLYGHGSPSVSTFFLNRNDALKQARWSTTDIVGEVNNVLGAGFSRLFTDSTFERHYNADSACEHMLTGPIDRATISMVSLGVFGDCGMYSSAGFLTADGITRQNMLTSRTAYDKALTGRQVLTVTEGLTITHGSWCMAYFLALDNRKPLPPFLPHYRNEDGVFAALILKCIPLAYWALLPIAIHHDPLQARRYSVDYLQHASVTRLSDLIIAAINSCRIPELIDEPISRLDIVGRWLMGLSQLSDNEFSYQMRQALALHVSSQLSALENAMNDHALPEFWRRDCEEYRMKVLQRLISSDGWLPTEIERSSVRDRIVAVKNELRLFGTLVRYWPQMLKVAAQLSTDGGICRDLPS